MIEHLIAAFGKELIIQTERLRKQKTQISIALRLPQLLIKANFRPNQDRWVKIKHIQTRSKYIDRKHLNDIIQKHLSDWQRGHECYLREGNEFNSPQTYAKNFYHCLHRIFTIANCCKHRGKAINSAMYEKVIENDEVSIE